MRWTSRTGPFGLSLPVCFWPGVRANRRRCESIALIPACTGCSTTEYWTVRQVLRGRSLVAKVRPGATNCSPVSVSFVTLLSFFASGLGSPLAWKVRTEMISPSWTGVYVLLTSCSWSTRAMMASAPKISWIGKMRSSLPICWHWYSCISFAHLPGAKALGTLSSAAAAGVVAVGVVAGACIGIIAACETAQ